MATRKPHAALLKKEPTDLHAGLADYITRTTGHEVDAKTVGLVQRVYPLYLKSPAVAKAREAEAKRREEEARAKEEAKQQRLKDRLARIEEERRKVLADLGIEEGAQVIEAEDRFVQPKAEEPVEEADDEPEDDDDDDDDGEEQAEEVALGDDAEDDWDDDDDEEDF